MKNKKFIIICCVLILITTISLVFTSILKKQEEKDIDINDLPNKVFTHSISDSTSESSEEIQFDINKGKKKLTIKSKNDSIDDINKESDFTYAINNDTIYIYQANLTSAFKIDKNCIYDINNIEIKYCTQKDA